MDAMQAANDNLRRKNDNLHAALVAERAARKEAEDRVGRWEKAIHDCENRAFAAEAEAEVQRLRNGITGLAENPVRFNYGSIVTDSPYVRVSDLRALLAPQVQDKPNA